MVGQSRKYLDVALDPQAATLVTGGKDGRVKHWRRDGTLLATTPVLDAKGINQVLFSPSGQQVAIATKGGKTGVVASQGWVAANMAPRH